MSALVRDFSTNPKLDYCHALKAKVENESKTILQKCTTTGEAYNQLHYMLPMKEIMEKLNPSDIDTCSKAFTKLNEHLNEYGSYFYKSDC